MSRGANKLINQVKKTVLGPVFFLKKKNDSYTWYIHITMRKRVSTKLHSKLLLYGTILLLFMHNVDKLSQKCENLISTPRKMHSALCSFEHTPNPAEACPLPRQLVPLKHSTSSIIDILFSSNHNIHKNSCGLCFWASDPLIERFYSKPLITGSEAPKQRPHELL